MSKPTSYHCEEAQAERLRARHSSPKPVNRLMVFYHVACMGNWHDVFDAQSKMIVKCGLTPQCHVVGNEEDYCFVSARFPGAIWHGDDLLQYETPTLQALWEWARLNNLPDAAVLYFHTKGVSQPGDLNKQAWRILMEQEVIRKWKENMIHLEVNDMVGMNWMDSPDFPHFCGNFWMARCDWISSLTSPIRHRAEGGPWIAGHPWERMHAEMWLGHKFFHQVKSLRMCNEDLWSNQNASINLLTRAERSLLPVPPRDERCSFKSAFDPVSHPDAQFGCDKAAVHRYERMYDWELERYQETPVRLLEIGVLTGASLAGWRRFLGSSAKIVGVDINLSKLIHTNEETVCADATNSSIISRLEQYGYWDVIIDDGSHRVEDQMKTFTLLWPKLRRGGTYIIEDISDLAAFMAAFKDPVIYDTRNISGRHDDICAVFRKEP